MRKRAVLSMVVASLVAANSCHKTQLETRPAAGPEQHFSLLLEHSKTGWAAHCETGCSWKEVTMQCTNCKVRLDADGIHEDNVSLQSRGFAFVLDDSNGLSAHGLQGVRWLDLSWGCATAVCRSRISEEGVYVPAAAGGT